MIYITDTVWLQDFDVDTSEKFVEEASIPVVTLFNKDPDNHPFVIKFFNSPNAKVNSRTTFCFLYVRSCERNCRFHFQEAPVKISYYSEDINIKAISLLFFMFCSLFLSS